MCFGRFRALGGMAKEAGAVPRARRALLRAVSARRRRASSSFLSFFTVFPVVLPAGPWLTLFGQDTYNEDESKEARVLRSIGLPELLIILAVALLLFGGKKIPEVAKGLGEGIRNFKNALKPEEQPKPEEKKQA
jgi:sec-independent protein translocase protein TatA